MMRKMANNHFLRKIAQDELWDTMFFASGEVPKKEKNKDYTILSTTPFTLKIYTDRNINVNGTKCRSIREAKYFIQSKL